MNSDTPTASEHIRNAEAAETLAALMEHHGARNLNDLYEMTQRGEVTPCPTCGAPLCPGPRSIFCLPKPENDSSR